MTDEKIKNNVEYAYYVEIKSISKEDEDADPEIECSLVFETEEDAKEYGRKSCRIFEEKYPSLIYDYDIKMVKVYKSAKDALEELNRLVRLLEEYRHLPTIN